MDGNHKIRRMNRTQMALRMPLYASCALRIVQTIRLATIGVYAEGASPLRKLTNEQTDRLHVSLGEFESDNFR